MLQFPEVVALTAYFYVLKMGDMRWVYFEGAGLWWKARYYALAEALVNICLNVVLAKYFGVLGIILATLISLFFIDFIFSARILFRQYYRNGKLGEFFGDHARYFLVTLLLAFPSIYVCNLITVSGVLGLLLRLLVCTVCSVAGYFLLYHRTARYQDAMDWIRRRWKMV